MLGGQRTFVVTSGADWADAVTAGLQHRSVCPPSEFRTYRATGTFTPFSRARSTWKEIP
jgi:hypothetical protein